MTNLVDPISIVSNLDSKLFDQQNVLEENLEKGRLELQLITNDFIPILSDSQESLKILTRWIVQGGVLFNLIAPYLQKWCWYRCKSSGEPIFAREISTNAPLLSALYEQIVQDRIVINRLHALIIFDALSNMSFPITTDNQSRGICAIFVLTVPIARFIDTIIRTLSADQPPNIRMVAGGILHGFARYMPADLMQHFPGITDTEGPLSLTLLDAMGSHDDNMKGLQVQILLAMSHLVGNEESSVLTKNPLAIPILVDVLNASLRNMKFGILTFGISGILDGMLRIVASDANKVILLSTHLTALLCYIICIQCRAYPIVDSIISALNIDISLAAHDTIWSGAGGQPTWATRPECLQSAILCLEHMAFYAETKEFLVKVKFDEILRILLNSSNDQTLKDATANLTWHITKEMDGRGVNDALQCPIGIQTNVKAKHVMISYCWANQGSVRSIATHLQTQGIRIWYDENDMRGSIIEAMAQAVEDAEVVVMCMSKSYKESANCRLEAEYAMQQRKHIIPLMMENFKPSGWLGLILGQKLFYSFSSGIDANQDSLQILTDELHRLVSKEVVLPTVSKGSIKLPVIDKNPMASTIPEWTVDDVTAWLTLIDHIYLTDKFREGKVDGRALLEMKQVLIADYKFIFDLLRSEFEVKTVGQTLNLLGRIREL